MFWLWTSYILMLLTISCWACLIFGGIFFLLVVSNWNVNTKFIMDYFDLLVVLTKVYCLGHKNKKSFECVWTHLMPSVHHEVTLCGWRSAEIYYSVDELSHREHSPWSTSHVIHSEFNFSSKNSTPCEQINQENHFITRFLFQTQATCSCFTQ